MARRDQAEVAAALAEIDECWPTHVKVYPKVLGMAGAYMWVLGRADRSPLRELVAPATPEEIGAELEAARSAARRLNDIPASDHAMGVESALSWVSGNLLGPHPELSHRHQLRSPAELMAVYVAAVKSVSAEQERRGKTYAGGAVAALAWLLSHGQGDMNEAGQYGITLTAPVSREVAYPWPRRVAREAEDITDRVLRGQLQAHPDIERGLTQGWLVGVQSALMWAYHTHDTPPVPPAD